MKRQVIVYAWACLCMLGTSACSDTPECEEKSYLCEETQLKQCIDGRWTDKKTCDSAALCNAELGQCNCVENEFRCNKTVLQQCLNGSWTTHEGCFDMALCRADLKYCAECIDDSWRCAETSLDKCVDGRWQSQETCSDSASCNAAENRCDACVENAFKCEDGAEGGVFSICKDGEWMTEACADSVACDGNRCSNDACPEDILKTEPGICGCGVEDKDIDNDGTIDCPVLMIPKDQLPALKELSELEGKCAEWEYPKHPVVEFPDLPEYGYETTIDLEKYHISNVYDVSKAEETTKGMNQAIADAYEAGFRRIRIPDGHYPIGYSPETNFTEGIRPLDGMALIMSDKVILQMIPTNTYDCNIINLRTRKNIYIEGGELIGEKYDHTMSAEGSTDEECNIITSYYSHHIFINKMKLRQSHGDGILIYDRAPSADKPQTSAHFILANSDFDDNFRQGISVVGVNGLRITNNEIHHTSGTSPQFGIDFEGVGRPNTNVIIDHNHFHDNVGGDIVNNDVYNLFVEYNTFSQGDMKNYIDNPFIPKAKSSYIMYQNKFEKFTSSIGCGYAVCCSYGTDMNQPYPSFFVKNEIEGTRLMLTNRNKVCIKENIIREGMLSATQLKEMRLIDNKVERYTSSGIRYSFKDVYGTASGNIACNNDGCNEVTDLNTMNDNEAFGFNLHMW